jgi:holo-[acyl-carrier protein] synthase
VSSQLHERTALATLIEQTASKLRDACAGPLVGVGVDVVDLDVFARQLHVSGERFLRRLLLPAEIDYCAGRLEQLATRVAAKEAVVKALRCGFRGVDWREVEIVSAANGAPSVVLCDRAAAHARRLGVEEVHISLAHENRAAVAVAIATQTRQRSGTAELGGEGDD